MVPIQLTKANAIRSLFFFLIAANLASCVQQAAPSTPTVRPTRVVIVVATNPLPTATLIPSPTIAPSNTPLLTLLPPSTATNIPTKTATRLPPTAVPASPTANAVQPTRTLAASPPPATTIAPTKAPTVQPTNAPTQAPAPPPAAFQPTQLMVIPEGKLRMGTANNETDLTNEKPQHDVRMGTFSIERFEVTNAQYAACVSAGACTPAGERLNGDNFPVVNVTWFQADAYCKWIGRHLPNEAEWERAAKGVDNWRYAWSNDFGMAFEWNAIYHGSPLSFCEVSCPLPHSINDVNDGWPTSAPVGTFGGSAPRQDLSKGFNVEDMNGNVSEWVSNWYDPHAYQEGYPIDVFGPSNPTGAKVYRGGSWATEPVRLAQRFSLPPDQMRNDLGFRCAQ